MATWISRTVDRLHPYEAYSTTFLRIGLGAVFFWFGIGKFVNPDIWIGYIPEAIKTLLPFSLVTLNLIQGIVETIVGLFLILGFLQQAAAAIAGIILIPIIITMFVYDALDLALRDFGLLMIALSLTVTPETILSVDSWLKNMRRIRVTENQHS